MQKIKLECRFFSFTQTIDELLLFSSFSIFSNLDQIPYHPLYFNFRAG